MRGCALRRRLKRELDRNLAAVREDSTPVSREKLFQGEGTAGARVLRWVLGASKDPRGGRCGCPREGNCAVIGDEGRDTLQWSEQVGQGGRQAVLTSEDLVPNTVGSHWEGGDWSGRMALFGLGFGMTALADTLIDHSEERLGSEKQVWGCWDISVKKW